MRKPKIETAKTVKYVYTLSWYSKYGGDTLLYAFIADADGVTDIADMRLHEKYRWSSDVLGNELVGQPPFDSEKVSTGVARIKKWQVVAD